MKIPLAVLFGFIVGIVLYNIRGEAILTTYNKHGWYVSIVFTESGKTMALSDRFSSQEECLSSHDYQLHRDISKESGAKIICSNSVDIL